MIKDGYYYPDWIWKNKLHKNEETGEYEGTCVFNFIEGNRRAGKSVGVGLYCLDDYFKYGYKTVLLRRFQKDFEDPKKLALENFWTKSWFTYLDYHPEHADAEMKFDGHHMYINNDIFSYPVAINRYNDVKNRNFQNVRTLIYDEFVTEDGTRLNNEVSAVYNIYDTIARGREDALKTTSVVFISNVITTATDFHIELGIDRELRADTKKLYRPEKGYCLEKVNNEAAAEEVNQSAFAKLLKAGQEGRNYLGYSQQNEWKDDTSFVDSTVKGNDYLYNLMVDGTEYAVRFIGKTQSFLFTDRDVQKGFGRCYACRKEDHTGKTILVKDINRELFIPLKKAYAAGKVVFNSQRAKNAFISIYTKL